eukprot:CAMPEP_0177659172 /NCGR_PEP_ID=MMETSP0447-20121125/17289_1 /TAXON_ID=0 /ORGANISM="Stygamoeba regulata, Strain BSH-02190019" /LENGTH=527 /DNA_ID=CAMNT_0019164001 /DNA_START=143 /DNA_END=1724 /DNA_ORIENTATION=+
MRAILDRGGNAMDAVIAGLLVSCTSEAMLCSIGGGGFFVVHQENASSNDACDAPASNASDDDSRKKQKTSRSREVVIDAMSRMPSRSRASDLHRIEVDFGEVVQPFWIGAASATEPTLLAGVLYAHRHFGKLDFGEVVAPAIREAREGIRLSAFTAHTFHLLDAILRSTPGSQETFMKKVGDEYESLKEGDLFRNERFAEFLELLVANPDPELLRPEYEAAGIIYEPWPIEELEPLTTKIGVHRVCTVPPPYPGGLLMQHSLLQMDLDKVVNGTTLEQWEEIATALLETQEARTKFVDGAVLDGSVVTKLLAKDSHLGGTTHLSAIDREGNAVSVTITNGEGSGVVLSKYGIMTNNFLGEKDLHPTGFGKHSAGTRLPSMMCPTLARHRDGTWAALGSGGSERIRSVVSQVVARMLGGRSVHEAVCAPRLHWDGTQLHIECPLEDLIEDAVPSVVSKQEQERAALRWRDLLTAIRRRLGDSVPVNPWYRRAMYFGGVHVAYQCSGDLRGLTSGQADPRRAGTSADAY